MRVDERPRPPKHVDAGDLEFAEDRSVDLTNRDCLSGAVRSAFPLPPSGAFKDLLDALDAGDRATP